MKRDRLLTRRERRAAAKGPVPAGPGPMDCMSCGRTIGREEFASDPPTAVVVVCEHGSRFPACAECEVAARHAVAEHDRDGSDARRPSAGKG